jgi:hypothetical protein
MPRTDYIPGGAPMSGPQPAPDAKDDAGYWSLARCKRAYLDYLGAKRAEIDEQQDARRYRHAAHWTAAQIEVLNKRKQPVVTYNRIGRKIDGIIGLVERLRQDPKAYPRTPRHERGAELATAVLNFVLDQQDWKAKSPVVAESAAVDGIGGIELNLVPAGPARAAPSTSLSAAPGAAERSEDPARVFLEQRSEDPARTPRQAGDADIEFDVVESDGFFYDPRSFRLDFSDARFLGTGKWTDLDTAKELVPDKADALDSAADHGNELTSNSDRDNKWFSADGDIRRVRLVDLWYRHNGEWCWCLFTGAGKLAEGRSPFTDEKGRTISKYIMFSGAVDHDGDRYGFVRNLKSAQDEINQRRSKGLHELNTRRIIGEHGAFDDVELARREAARPDGMVLRNPGFSAEFDDSARLANVEGQLRFLEDAKAEIENFGPNPALIGQGIENKSGRAIALMQQAGIAELGPYFLGYRGWKIRVYRALWNAVRQHWRDERWIRVTDDEDVAQFVRLNGMAIDPRTGAPALLNAVGELDVDIILDEGPDHINLMADAYDTLTALAGQGARIPPQVLIELSPLAGSVKRKVLAMLEAPDPLADRSRALALEGAAAKVGETQSKTLLNVARARAEAPAMPPDAPAMIAPNTPGAPIPMPPGAPMPSGPTPVPPMPMPPVPGAPMMPPLVSEPAPAPPSHFELPPDLQLAQALADIDETRASAAHKRAQAGKLSAMF